MKTYGFAFYVLFALAASAAHAAPADLGVPNPPLPAGNGGGSTTHALGAWVVPPVSGIYTFPQTSTNGRPVFMAQEKPGPVILVAGRAYRLHPWAGPLTWKMPDGRQGEVPPQYILGVTPTTVIHK
jgi:hypothetical protein